MFTNPNTILVEVLVLIAVIAFIATIVGVYIYKKTHHLPTGECACCHKSSKKLLKEYYKCYCNKK